MKTLSGPVADLVSLFRCVLLTALPLSGFSAPAVTYEYDGLNRLMSATYESGQIVTYTYDAAGNVLSITSAGPQSGPIDVTDKVQVQIGGVAYHRGTHHFYGTVTLTNISGSDIAGPVRMVLSGLSEFAQLVDADGQQDGWPYVTLPEGAGLPTGGSGQLTVEYILSSQNIPDYAPILYSGSF